MKIISKFKKYGVVVGTAALMVATSPAMAEGGNTAAITSAISSGKTMLETATGGLIALAAVVFGVGMVVSLLRRG